METIITWVIAIAILAGLIPAFIAHSKGRNFFLWWAYGGALFFVALPHAILLKGAEGSRKCVYCNTWSKPGASFCAKCGYEFIDF